MARHHAVGALACAGAVLLAGCAGGRPASSGSSPIKSAPSAVTATSAPQAGAARAAPLGTRRAPSAPAPRTSAAPWPGGDRTPPPKVVDQGTDYVAIWYSLDGYRTWLEQHHPDPALIARVWVKGGSLAASFQKELGDLASHHMRWVDINERLHVQLASVVDHEATLLVDEQNEGDRALDDAGRVIFTRWQRLDAHYIVLMDRDAEGHWRLVSSGTRITNDTEVHL
jgi:hypothetical protein